MAVVDRARLSIPCVSWLDSPVGHHDDDWDACGDYNYDDYGDDYDDCDVFVDAGGKSFSGWFVLHF